MGSGKCRIVVVVALVFFVCLLFLQHFVFCSVFCFIHASIEWEHVTLHLSVSISLSHSNISYILFFFREKSNFGAFCTVVSIGVYSFWQIVWDFLASSMVFFVVVEWACCIVHLSISIRSGCLRKNVYALWAGVQCLFFSSFPFFFFIALQVLCGFSFDHLTICDWWTG